MTGGRYEHGFTLPVPSPVASRWAPYDFRRDFAVSPAAVGGIMIATLDVVPDNELWLVERVTVSTTSVAATSAVLYVDTIDPRNAVDYTAVGNFDIADESAPIQLPAGTTLLCKWSGATAGAIGTMRVQWTSLRQVSS